MQFMGNKKEKLKTLKNVSTLNVAALKNKDITIQKNLHIYFYMNLKPKSILNSLTGCSYTYIYLLNSPYT